MHKLSDADLARIEVEAYNRGFSAGRAAASRPRETPAHIQWLEFWGWMFQETADTLKDRAG